MDYKDFYNGSNQSQQNDSYHNHRPAANNNNGNQYPNRNGFNANRGGNGNFNRGGFKRRPEDEGPAKLYKPYVITGNKNIPDEVLEKFKRLVKEIEPLGYTMRSAGREGPEDAVENLVNDKEIHLPWRGFDEKESKFTFTSAHAKEIAAMFAPGYEALKPVIQTFLACNVRLVLGKDLRSPALFVICWSEDGVENIKDRTAKTGNVGHIIAIASALKLPVFNFGKSDAEERLKRYLELPRG